MGPTYGIFQHRITSRGFLDIRTPNTIVLAPLRFFWIFTIESASFALSAPPVSEHSKFIQSTHSQERYSVPSTGLGAHAILRDRQKKHASVCFLGPICLTSVILNVCGHWWPLGYGWPGNDVARASAGISANGDSSGRSVAMNVSFMCTKS